MIFIVLITISACLFFIMILLFLFKMNSEINKAIINEIFKINNTGNGTHEDLLENDFDDILHELKKINYYPNNFIEVDCHNSTNLAIFVVKGIGKSIGLTNKNLDLGINKLPKNIKKNIQIEKLDFNLNLPKNSLIMINNKDYSDEMNKKIFDLCSKNILLVQELPNTNIPNIKIIKKTNKYIMLK